MFGFRPNKRQDSDFEALVESHLDTMYAVAMRLTRDPSKAQDLVQDTVVKALRFRDRFEMGTNFKAWVTTILTNTYFHRYRRSKKEKELLSGARLGDVQAQLHSEASTEAMRSPENSFIKNMLSDDVVVALDALPDDYRLVILMCDVQGLSYKEAAEAVGRPVGTVMSRLYRGRRILEGKLAALAYDQGIIKEAPTAAAGGSAIVDLRTYRRRARS